MKTKLPVFSLFAMNVYGDIVTDQNAPCSLCWYVSGTNAPAQTRVGGGVRYALSPFQVIPLQATDFRNHFDPVH